MPRRSSNIARALTRKGFEEKRSGHHVFYLYVTMDGLRSSVTTKMSHGAVQDIGDTLIGLMAGQCKLARRKFLDLVDCTLGQAEYEKLLRDDQHIR